MQIKHRFSFLSCLPSWWEDGLITLAGLLSIAAFLAFYDQAFPSASIDLALSRAEIAQRADDYLQAKGYSPEGYEFALSFEWDGWAAYYLQHQLGVADANHLIQTQRLPIWYWHARWFRPLQKEEFSVYLSPDGELTAFDHSLMEDAPGAQWSQAQARSLAEAYLSDERGWQLADWEPVTASTQERPGGRVDHHFEWKRRDFAVGESELRISVDVQGERVDSYTFWLKSPEAFQRYFAEQRTRANFFNDISFIIGMLCLGGAAVAVYLVASWQGRLVWPAGVLPAGAAALVSLLSDLNYLPLYKAGYNTTQDYTLFWLTQVMGVLISAGFSGAVVLALWNGGRVLGKLAWPRQDKILARGPDRWGLLARSAWRGLMLGGLMGGYVVGFYLVATRLLGGWTPLDTPYTGLYATPAPFLGPLAAGFLPAMWEELMFRLAGISLLLWLARSYTGLNRWAGGAVALLLPGALWGFAHLSYVRDPFYMRGIELTLAAVFLEGLFFLRFDLTTTVVAHFAYNAALATLPLLRSGEAYFVASGVFVLLVMLAPLVPGLVRAAWRWRAGHKLADSLPHIALARLADVRTLVVLKALTAEDTKDTNNGNGRKSALNWETVSDDPTIASVGLWVGDRIEGVALGRCAAPAGSTGQAGELLWVYVSPAWRRRYWGSKLVHAWCDLARERGGDVVRTAADEDDKCNWAFWADQGWRPVVKEFAHRLNRPARLPWRARLAQWVARRRGLPQTKL